MSKYVVPFLLGLVLAGCMTPRSLVFGQTAAIPAPGSAQAALSLGGAFQNQRVNFSQAGMESSTASALEAPTLEANLELGLSKVIGLAIHASNVGVQPGLKFSFGTDRIRFALLPEAAIGYSHTSITYTFPGNASSSSPATYWSYLAGLKLLVSAAGGLYGGIGYDYQSYTIKEEEAQTSGYSWSWHNLMLALGWDLAFSWGHLRPEVCARYSPSGTYTTWVPASGQTRATTSTSANSVVIMPSVTFVTGSFDESGAGPALPDARKED